MKSSPLSPFSTLVFIFQFVYSLSISVQHVAYSLDISTIPTCDSVRSGGMIHFGTQDESLTQSAAGLCSIEADDFNGTTQLLAVPIGYYVLQLSGLGEHNSENHLLSLEAKLEDDFLFVQISIELWTQSQDEFSQEQQHPHIEISYQYEQTTPFTITRKYEFNPINGILSDSTQMNFSQNNKWKKYFFTGFIQNARNAVKIEIPSGEKKYQQKTFIKQVIIKQSNQSEARSSTATYQFNCNSQHVIEVGTTSATHPRVRMNRQSSKYEQKLEFEPVINSCVRNESSRCPENQIERLSPQHECVSNCPFGEREHHMLRHKKYQPICLQINMLCDQFDHLLGCKTCDRNSKICFECSPGFSLTQSSQCERNIFETTNNQIRILAVDNCSKPVCSECLNASMCLKCKSPYVNVHGSCVLCGRGTQLSSSLADAYCKKTTYAKNSCSNYDESSSTCKGCYLGYALTNACNQNVFCTDTTKFDLTSSSCGTCSDSITFCTRCATANQCLECASGKKLAISDYSVMNPSVVCLASCPTGFYADSDGFCAPCGMNCDSCSNGSLTCNTCKSGYVLDSAYASANPTLKQRCIPYNACCSNCKTCVLLTLVCTACYPGYYSVLSACVKCGAGCKTCSSSTVCTECYDGSTSATCPTVTCAEGQFMNQNLACESCASDCRSCWNGVSCDVCNPGFVQEKGSCVACPLNCLICSDANTCLSCDSNYQVDGNNQCELIPISCLSNQYYNGIDCSNCDLSCSTCSDSTHCATCANNSTPINGICLSCTSSQYADNSYVCTDCPANCADCQNFLGCTACNSGYFYVSATQECKEYTSCGNGNTNLPMLINDQLISKDCDDFNVTDGDGCSATCSVETGFTCTYNTDSMRSVCTSNQTNPDNSGGGSTNNPDPNGNSGNNGNGGTGQEPQKNGFKIEVKYSESLNAKKNSGSMNPIIVVKFNLPVILRQDGQIDRMLGELSDESRAKYIRESTLLEITDTTQESYSYSVYGDDSSLNIDIEFQVYRNIVSKQLNVQFNDAFVSANNLSNASDSMLFPDTWPISTDEKQLADNMATAGAVAGQTFAFSLIPVIIFSNFPVLFNALDLFQMIFYLKYVNIRFPYNVQEFLYIMTNFQMPISFNFIALILEEYPLETPDVPQSYDENEVSGAFLDNTGDSFSQLFILIAVHLLLIGVVKICRDTNMLAKNKYAERLSKYLQQKLNSAWQFGWYLDMYWEAYLSIIVGCTLQFYGFNTDDTQSIINMCFFAISLVVTILSPFLFWRIIMKYQHQLEEESIKNKWSMLYETLRIQNTHQVFPIITLTPASPAIASDSGTTNAIATANADHVLETRAETAATVKTAPSNEMKSTQSLENQQGGSRRSSNNNNNSNNGVSEFAENEGNLSKGDEQNKRRKSWMSKFSRSDEEEKCEKLSFRLSKYFFVALYVRKIFFGVWIVVLYEYPLLQLLLIDGLNAIIVAYLLYAAPFEKKAHNVKGIICEILMIIAQISLKFLIDDPEDGNEPDRMSLGWIFIACFASILGVQLLFILANLFSDVKQYFVSFLLQSGKISDQRSNKVEETSDQGVKFPNRVRNLKYIDEAVKKQARRLNKECVVASEIEEEQAEEQIDPENQVFERMKCENENEPVMGFTSMKEIPHSKRFSNMEEVGSASNRELILSNRMMIIPSPTSVVSQNLDIDVDQFISTKVLAHKAATGFTSRRKRLSIFKYPGHQ